MYTRYIPTKILPNLFQAINKILLLRNTFW